jgi:hypothetical protein
VAPRLLETVALDLAVTFLVVTKKVAETLPAGTTTDTGTLTEASELVSVIFVPPTGAIEPRLTVPVLDFAPTTEVGFRTSEFRTGELITRVAEGEAAPNFAVIETVFRDATATVLIGKDAAVLPAKIVTEAGTTAEDSELVSFTISPPTGAGLLSVTAPVTLEPP